ncbi:MAG: hypothetical protein M3N91_17000 [Pseudomonadota bacterium]|nr:hypothetical protein [Pseudomonadota bacterium]
MEWQHEANQRRQRLQDKLVEHKQYIDKHGEDIPEIKNWSWPG